MCLSLYLLSLSKPEVQAQVRACRSFLCRLNLLLPIFCLAAFISFLSFLSHSITIFMCLSSHFLSSLLSLLFLAHISWLQSSSNIEVKVQQYVDLILVIRVSSEALPGDSITTGKMPQPSVHDKSCQSKLTLTPCQRWWLNQQSPGRSTQTVKRGKC